MVLCYAANGKKDIPKPIVPTDNFDIPTISGVTEDGVRPATGTTGAGTLGVAGTDVGSTSSGPSAPPSRSVSASGSTTGLVE